MGASTSRFFDKATAKMTYDPELEKQLAAEKQNSRKARANFQELLQTSKTKTDEMIKQNRLTPEGSTLTEVLFKQTSEWLINNPTATEAEITEKMQDFRVNLADIYSEDKNRLYYLNAMSFLEATNIDLQARNKISNEVYEKVKAILEKEKVWYNKNKSESLQVYKTQVDETVENISAAINDPIMMKPIREGIEKVSTVEDSTEVKELKATAEQAQRDKEALEKQTFSPSRVTSKVGTAVMISFFVALYIVFGLFAGSMAANDSVTRPIPIRILMFFFGFLFWLPVLCYYGYRTLKGYPPYFATFIPLYMYDPEKEVKTMLTSLYYYTDSPIIRHANEKFLAAANAAK